MEKLKRFLEYANSVEDNLLYLNTTKAVENWLEGKDYKAEQDVLINHLATYDLDPLMKEDSNKKRLNKFREAICSRQIPGIALAIAPYLFIWNIRRFDDYSKIQFFCVKKYFNILNCFFEENKELFISYKTYNLISNPIEYEKIESIYNLFNEKLKEIGSGNNEYVGFMKLTHILNPKLFPLIDNDIARGLHLLKPNSKESLTIEKCIIWNSKVQGYLEHFKQKEFEAFEEINVSLIRSLDIALMHYRIEPYGKISSAKNKVHIQALGFKI